MRRRQDGQTVAPLVHLIAGRNIGWNDRVIRHDGIVPEPVPAGTSFTMFLLCSQEPLLGEWAFWRGVREPVFRWRYKRVERCQEQKRSFPNPARRDSRRG